MSCLILDRFFSAFNSFFSTNLFLIFVPARLWLLLATMLGAQWLPAQGGGNWQPLATGTNNTVRAVAYSASGNTATYIGGDFTTAGGIPANYVACWNGIAWSSLGTGLNGRVNDLEYDGYYLYAAGQFTLAGSIGAARVARWDGLSWSALGAGFNGEVLDLKIGTNGEVFAAGSFTKSGTTTVNYVARWDGANWTALGSGMNNPVHALAFDMNKELVAGGQFTMAGGIAAARLARWNGFSWNPVGDGVNGTVRSITLGVDQDLYIGGEFTQAGTFPMNYVVRYTANTWVPLGDGMNGIVQCVQADGFGRLYASGNFTSASGVATNYVARWDGLVWEPVSGGMNGAVMRVGTDYAGNLLAAGSFSKTGTGTTVNNIATIPFVIPSFALPAGNQGRITTCETYFLDIGGLTEPYPAFYDGAVTFCPEDSVFQTIGVDFPAFDVTSYWDNLHVYDGPDQQYPKIYGNNNSEVSSLGAGGWTTDYPLPKMDFISSHVSGCLTFRFQSFPFFSQGWVGRVRCLPRQSRWQDDCDGITLKPVPQNQPVEWFESSTRYATPSKKLYNTPPQPACPGGSADDDVWFQFKATQAEHTILVSSSTEMAYEIFSDYCPYLQGSPYKFFGCSDQPSQTYDCFVPGTTYYLRCYTKAKGGVDRFYIAILEAPQTSTTCSNAQRIKVPATLPLNQNFWITPDGGCAPNNNLGCINQPNHPTYFWLKAKTAGTVKLRLNCSNPAAQLGIAVWKLPNGSPTNNTTAAQCGNSLDNCATNTPLYCDNIFNGNADLNLPNTAAGNIYLIAVFNYDNAQANIEIKPLTGNTVAYDTSAIECVQYYVEDCYQTDVPLPVHNISGTILINDLAPKTGYLVVSSDRGYSQTIPAPFPRVIQFQLSNLQAEGGSSHLRVRFSAQQSDAWETAYNVPDCNGDLVFSENWYNYYNPFTEAYSTAEAGTTAGNLQISDQGGAQYVIPVLVPEGAGGIQPSLALAYNSSNGGSGILGMGWTLEGMSMIARSANTHDVDGWNQGVTGGPADKLSLDGERLIQTNYGFGHPEYFAAGVTYKCRLDQFKKVESWGDTLYGPKGFTVRSKAGLLMEYGSTANARVGNSTATYFWLLNKVSDTQGNYYTIEYFNNGAEFYPLRIQYAGNTAAQLAPAYQVDFSYISKPDTAVTWQGSLLQRNTKLLSNIRISAKANTVRRYWMTYGTPSSAYDSRSKLTAIQECGADGKCLEPTRFDWDYPGSISFYSNLNKIPKNRIRHLDDQLAPADFNGDGLPDFVVTNTTQDSLKVFLNNRQGSFTESFSGRITSFLTNSASYSLADAQVYLGDFNGDNTTDLLVVDHKNGLNQFIISEASTDRLTCYLGGTEPFAPKDSIKQKNGENFELNFADFDGNGVPEIFAYLPSTGKNDLYVKVVGSDGVPFYQKTVGGFLEYPDLLKNQRFRFIDLTGDGNDEIVYAQRGTNNQVVLTILKLNVPLPYYFSQSDGFPGSFPGITRLLGNDANFQTTDELYFPDLNGDHLPELVKRTGNQLQVYLNLGSGLEFQLQPATLSVGSSTYPLFVDFNLDGRSDYILYDFNTGGNTWYLNKAYNSFELRSELTNKLNPALLPAGTVGCPPQPTALNRNSFSDWYWYQACGANQTYLNANGGRPNLWLTNGFQPGMRINTITNGLGLQLSIDYSTTNDPDVYSSTLSNLGLKPSNTPYAYEVIKSNLSYQVIEIEPFEFSGRMPVVRSYSITNGFASSNYIRYYYQRALMDKSGAGFRGFERVITHDLTSDMVTFRNFSLMTPGNMSQTSISSFFRGKLENLSDTYSVDTIITETYPASYVYNSAPFNRTYKTYFPFTYKSITYNYDLDGKLVSTLTQEQQTDAFGNITGNVTDYGDGHRDSVVSTYSNDTNKWLLGRMTRTELYRQAPGAAPVKRTSAFEYDAQTGLLKKEILEPDLPPDQRLEMRYERDAFGNIRRETKRFFNGSAFVERNTFKEFDPVYGKLLLNNYNDLGHTVSFTYDPVLGLPTGETDENGVKTSMEYDGFGRTTRIVQADGNWKNTRYERCKQGITVGCPTDAIFLVEETMANGRTERSYFDKMNREVQSVETGFGDRTIYTRNYFNERGQLVRTSQPFFANETPHWNGWVYDPIGREIAQTQDDIIVSTTHYEGKKIIYTNALGQTRTEEFSVNGRLQRTVDTEGNALEYTYDAQGNTILIQYPGSHAVQMTYDLFGRQTSLSDPDIGLYHYTYNLGGELIWEQDPMGQVTVFTYDTLGRPATRTDPEELTQFSYDNAPYAKGRLIEKVSRPPGSPTGLITSYTYGYDALSRPTSTAMRFNSDAQTYTLGIRYDHIGRDSVLLYPGAQGSAASLRMVYDAQGFHVEVRNLSSGKVYWHLDSLDARQNITQYTLGNGVVTRRNYDPSFDFLTQIRSRNPKGVDVQNQSYTYNWVGNLTQRQDHVAGYTENFSYDALNRLVQAEIPGQTPLAMTYDVLGNITSKSDVGQYYYGENGAGPHVLTRLEFNNNEAGCLPSVLASYQYTSFDKLRSVAYGSDSLVLDYTMDHQRFQQRLYKNQTLARSKYYILGVLEREITASATRDRYFVKTPVGTVATLEYPDNGPAEVRYLMQDHLGSICALTNASGDLLQTLGYDAWGHRRLPNGMPLDSLNASNYLYDRGFTGHEHLDWFELVNMNGRVYDPTLGRFLSPDPFVEDVKDIQVFNRYAYVGNNPLSLTDPSGYFSFKKAFRSVVKRVAKVAKGVAKGASEIAKGNVKQGLKRIGQAYIDVARYSTGFHIVNERGEKIFGKETWNTIVVTGAVIAVTVATGGAGAPALATALFSGAAGGFTGGALSVVLAGGNVSDALKAGLKGAAIGAASAGLSYGVGQAAAAGGYSGNAMVSGNNIGGYITKIAGHGVTQGTISKVQGGSFESGFLSGAFTAAASPLIGVVSKDITARLTVAAVVGGTASEIGGGKFSNGAASGVVVQMYNGIFSELKAKGTELAEKASQTLDRVNERLEARGYNSYIVGGATIALGGVIVGGTAGAVVAVAGVAWAAYGTINHAIETHLNPAIDEYLKK